MSFTSSPMHHQTQTSRLATRIIIMLLWWSIPHHHHLGLTIKGQKTKLSLFFHHPSSQEEEKKDREYDSLIVATVCENFPIVNHVPVPSPPLSPIVHFICCMHLINWDVTRFNILSSTAALVGPCASLLTSLDGVVYNPLAESSPGHSKENDLTGGGATKADPKNIVYKNKISSCESSHQFFMVSSSFGW